MSNREVLHSRFDALLVLSFGGPEGPDEVRPFLENVVRGRGVPPERLDAVEQHYQQKSATVWCRTGSTLFPDLEVQSVASYYHHTVTLLQIRIGSICGTTTHPSLLNLNSTTAI